MNIFPQFTVGAVAADGSSQPRPPDDADFWYENTNSRNVAGVTVTADNASRVATVMACVKIIAESLAAMPLEIRRRTIADTNYAALAPDSPLFDIFDSRPNNFQSPFEYKEMLGGHVALRGNHYSLILSGRRGAVDQLIPLHPDRMTVHLLDDYTLGYEYRREDGKISYFNQDEMFHVRGYSFDGITGVSPVEYAANPIGLAIAAEAYQGSFYKNGGRPGGVLEHPAVMGEQAVTNFRRDWKMIHGGPYNAGKIAILEEGMKYNELGVSNTDAQHLETRKFQNREIASFYRMQLHMLGDLEFATFSNIESQGMDFLNNTLTPWMVRVCEAIKRCLIYEPLLIARFDARAIQRADRLTRYRCHAIARQWGWKSVNDIRAEEGDAPITDAAANEYLQPVNMQPIGTPQDNGKQNEGDQTIGGRAASDNGSEVSADSSVPRITGKWSRNGTH